jgi:hypothetical protein
MALAIFCALEIEARIFIDTYHLKKTTQINHFKIFSSPELIVMITGIGAKNCQIAIGLFKGLFPAFQGNLINFGCAGHKKFPLGSLFFSHIVENQSDSRFFLNPNHDLLIPFSKVKTVEQADHDYLEDTLKEMEAFYFIDAALLFFTIDQLHVLKIVSDNEQNPFKLLNKETLLKLCYTQKTVLQKTVTFLTKSQQDPALNLIETLKEQFHLTETKAHAIKRLLERAIALDLTIDASLYEDLNLFEAALKEKIAKAVCL